mmetsp:Transcript_2469/g.5603  ORF Transcript_2469/g.5603 Transcript_2469/m.5603 type:complete len:284 (+) Transcript_2469:236-1087(+)
MLMRITPARCWVSRRSFLSCRWGVASRSRPPSPSPSSSSPATTTSSASTSRVLTIPLPVPFPLLLAFLLRPLATSSTPSMSSDRSIGHGPSSSSSALLALLALSPTLRLPPPFLRGGGDAGRMRFLLLLLLLLWRRRRGEGERPRLGVCVDATGVPGGVPLAGGGGGEGGLMMPSIGRYSKSSGSDSSRISSMSQFLRLVAGWMISSYSELNVSNSLVNVGGSGSPVNRTNRLAIAPDPLPLYFLRASMSCGASPMVMAMSRGRTLPISRANVYIFHRSDRSG